MGRGVNIPSVGGQNCLKKNYILEFLNFFENFEILYEIFFIFENFD